jgi:hypothetical protein
VVEWVIEVESVPTPVIFSEYVPLGVLLPTLTARVEELDGAAGFGLKVAVAPEGKPLADRLTDEL